MDEWLTRTEAAREISFFLQYCLLPLASLQFLLSSVNTANNGGHIAQAALLPSLLSPSPSPSRPRPLRWTFCLLPLQRAKPRRSSRAPSTATAAPWGASRQMRLWRCAASRWRRRCRGWGLRARLLASVRDEDDATGVPWGRAAHASGLARGARPTCRSRPLTWRLVEMSHWVVRRLVEAACRAQWRQCAGALAAACSSLEDGRLRSQALPAHAYTAPLLYGTRCASWTIFFSTLNWRRH